MATWYFNVTWHGNGGTGCPPDVRWTRESDTKPSPYYWTSPATQPTRTNYVFKGWGTWAGAQDENMPPITILVAWDTDPTSYFSNRNFYAVWWGNWYSTVQFNANGGTGAPESSSINVTQYAQPDAREYIIPTTIPIRDGYKFKGWSTTATGAATYQPGDTVNIPYVIGSSNPTILYAVWTKIKSHIKVKSSGNWVNAKVYAKVNSVWVVPIKVYAKKAGEWSESVS